MPRLQHALILCMALCAYASPQASFAVPTDLSSELSIWYQDLDGDGYGDPNNTHRSKLPILGYVERGMDCDDHDKERHPETLWFMDSDGDGFGDPAFTLIQCSVPYGYVFQGEDCDDTDPAFHPGAQELPATDDYDCDGIVEDDGDAQIIASNP